VEVNMATTEERIQILKMVQEGKISPDEAAQLLEALEESGDKNQNSSSESAPLDPETLGRKPRWLRVRVTDSTSGRKRVNVRLPISMVNIGLKMGARFSPELEGLDGQELMHMIESGEIGQIVDVQDDEDGEHVEVFLE
jgi:polyhydroxyalkanoate synthesis regulator phasin